MKKAMWNKRLIFSGCIPILLGFMILGCKVEDFLEMETAPGLQAPVDEQEFNDTAVTLSWDEVAGAESYILFIDDDQYQIYPDGRITKNGETCTTCAFISPTS